MYNEPPPKYSNGDSKVYISSSNMEKLPSISEFVGERHSSNPGSMTGLSTYTGYSYTPRSPSMDSFSTIHSGGSRSVYSRQQLPGERKAPTENDTALQARIRNEEKQKHNYELCKKVRVSMALIGILLLVAAIFMLSFYLPKQYEGESVVLPQVKPRLYNVFDESIIYKIANPFRMNFSTNVSELSTPMDVKPRLVAFLGELLSPDARKNRSIKVTNDSISMSFQELDLDLTTLNIRKLNFSEKCFQITWVAKYTTKLEDCFDINATHWFGLGEFAIQRWPLDKVSFPSTPFLTSDYLDSWQPFRFGSVLEPFMVNSKGVGIYIDENVPLHVSMNDKESGKFCIRADHTKYLKRRLSNSTNTLNYTVCVGTDIMKVHRVLSNHYIKKPTGVPKEQVFRKPIWSTWAKFKQGINQTIIWDFVHKIMSYGFERSHLQIDDQYTPEHGDFDFDPTKFNRLTFLINFLKSKGFDVTCWMSPFANLQSKIFLQGLQYWMKVGPKKILGVTKWWNGVGAILDTTDPKAQQWFINRLKEFQLLQIDGFKFDAGEINYLPVNYNFTNSQPNPNYFTKNYVKIASAFSGLSEVRAAYKSQEYPVLVRILDRSSVWGVQNGLQSVLTATLTFGILGYPYVLPDMVGGNKYYITPNKELYVRWAQLCAFLPVIQFSIGPWEFDQETVEIIKQALAIRKNMSDIIWDAAKSAPITGEPIVRPLWWYWPNDHETFVVDGAFMVGSEYLVAPVLRLNVISHTVYLPEGVWEEQWGERKVLNMTVGGFKQYNVTLWDICYFHLLNRTSELT